MTGNDIIKKHLGDLIFQNAELTEKLRMVDRQFVNTMGRLEVASKEGSDKLLEVFEAILKEAKGE